MRHFVWAAGGQTTLDDLLRAHIGDPYLPGRGDLVRFVRRHRKQLLYDPHNNQVSLVQ